jgi:uncharacterized membrane protein YdjX (TVP38/TMEM64 family)
MLKQIRQFYQQFCPLFRVCRKPRFWVAIALFLAGFLVTVGPLNVVFDQGFIQQQLETYECCAIAIFLTLYTILTVLGIPGIILTVAGGLVFGLFWGTIWSVLGATLGALGAFWTARYLLRDLAEAKFGEYHLLGYLKKVVHQNPLRFVLTLRFIPITPFNLINFLFGLTPIHWLPYTLGTFVGILPGTFAYTWLGVSGMDALQGRDRASFFLALTFLALLSAIPLCLRKD